MTILPKFKDLGLSKDMIHRLHEKGFESLLQFSKRQFLSYYMKPEILSQSTDWNRKTGAFGISIIEKDNTSGRSCSINYLNTQPGACYTSY